MVTVFENMKKHKGQEPCRSKHQEISRNSPDGSARLSLQPERDGTGEEHSQYKGCKVYILIEEFIHGFNIFKSVLLVAKQVCWHFRVEPDGEGW
jgi:hypothetical protein